MNFEAIGSVERCYSSTSERGLFYLDLLKHRDVNKARGVKAMQ